MEISSSCRIGKHFHNRKMVGEGSRSISTAKKRSARGRGAFPQRKTGPRGVAEHFYSEKMAGEGSRSILTAKFSFRSFNRPFRVCFFYITKDGSPKWNDEGRLKNER